MGNRQAEDESTAPDSHPDSSLGRNRHAAPIRFLTIESPSPNPPKLRVDPESLPESIEDIRQEISADADAVVFNTDLWGRVRKVSSSGLLCGWCLRFAAGAKRVDRGQLAFFALVSNFTPTGMTKVYSNVRWREIP
jgi:hypothetical protein